MRNSLNEVREYFIQESGRIYDESSIFAHYILSVYKTISRIIGIGCRAAGNGIIWIDRKIGAASALCGYATYHLLSTIEMVALRINTLMGVTLGGCGYALYKSCVWISKNIASAATHTARFVKTNWKQIIGYLLAFSVVIVCSGALYGFQAVALPLTIGFGVGLGIGGIIGVLTTKIFDPNDNYRGKNTLWDLLNFGIEQLDPNGVRPIVTAISVTVLLAASVIFPYALGGVFGLLIGNQLITKIGYNRNLGPDSESKTQQIRELRNQLSDALRRLNQLAPEENEGQ